MYSPTIGRFMQSDPIGYADGLNIYAYSGNDPVNGIDPSGLLSYSIETCFRGGTPVPAPRTDENEGPPIIVTAPRLVCSTTTFGDPTEDFTVQGSSGPTGGGAGGIVVIGARAQDVSTQCSSGRFASALGRADVQAAMKEAIRMGTDPKTSVHHPRVETGFTYGRVVGGGRGVTSVHTSYDPNFVETKSWTDQMSNAGIYDAEIFFHFHPGGTGLTEQDLSLVGPAIIPGQGFDGVVAFNERGELICYGK